MSEVSNSMVDRIKNRSRASVPERNMSLVEPATIEPNAVSASPPNPDLEGLPEVASRRQIRLETNLDDEIETFCKEQKITVETYFEALHLACRNQPELLQHITQEAKERLKNRKKAGKIRRLQTQIKQESLDKS